MESWRQSEVRQRSACDTFVAERLSCTEFFVGLKANGELETEVLCGQFYVWAFFLSFWSVYF